MLVVMLSQDVASKYATVRIRWVREPRGKTSFLGQRALLCALQADCGLHAKCGNQKRSMGCRSSSRKSGHVSKSRKETRKQGAFWMVRLRRKKKNCRVKVPRCCPGRLRVLAVEEGWEVVQVGAVHHRGDGKDVSSSQTGPACADYF